MPPAYSLPDTDPHAMEFWLEGIRALSPSKKLEQVFTLTLMVYSMQEAEERRLHPGESDRRIHLRAAVRRYGREAVMRACGEDPCA